MKRITVFCVLTLMICVLAACNKKEEFTPEDAVISGTIIKSFVDKKKEIMVPAQFFRTKIIN